MVAVIAVVVVVVVVVQAVLCEAFGSYIIATFRNDGGNDPPLHYPVNSRMQHFIIATESVHLNTNKSEGADEIHPKILTSLAFLLATPLANLYSLAPGKIPVEWKSSIMCPKVAKRM